MIIVLSSNFGFVVNGRIVLNAIERAPAIYPLYRPVSAESISSIPERSYRASVRRMNRQLALPVRAGTPTERFLKTHPAYCNHEIMFDQNATNFPQVPLVMSNESTLNPYSDLEIRRYDGMTDAERSAYETKLRSLFKGISFDKKNVEVVRQNLLNFWV